MGGGERISEGLLVKMGLAESGSVGKVSQKSTHGSAYGRMTRSQFDLAVRTATSFNSERECACLRVAQ